MENNSYGAQVNRRSALVHGIIGGVIGGIIFAIAEMAMAMMLGMSPFVPLQMIGAIVLGQSVLPPAEATVTTVAVAVLVHMVLSAIYGVVLAFVVQLVPALGSSVLRLTAVGVVFGLGLWLVNFYVVAPIAFPWFAMADPVVQFIAHVFFFGAVLGYYLGSQFARRRVEV